MMNRPRSCVGRVASRGVPVAWRTGLSAAALLFALALPGDSVAAALFTVGPDDPASFFPVPRALTPLTTGAVVGAGTNLGDGSVGFNGGLAFRPGSTPADDRLFAVGNDALFNSTLYSVATGGSGLASVLPLGAGFAGGLAWHAGEDAFYVVASNFLGASSLHRVPAAGGISSVEFVADIGFGFVGGLTYNADDGKLYAISTDVLGVPRVLNAITLGPTPTVAPLFSLGDGSLAFNGGLAYNALGDVFYAVSNDASFASTLNTFTLAGAGAFDVVGAIGVGFGNSALALVPGVIVTPVPEPAGETLAATALALLALLGAAPRARRRRRGGLATNA